MRIVVSPQAGRDVTDILRTSKAGFGAEAMTRYRRLIQWAFDDLAADPSRIGTRSLSEELPEIRLYHIRHSRRRDAVTTRVASPRHVVAFTVKDESVEILRVLHDTMDFQRHLGGA